MPTIRATAIRASPVSGCGTAMPMLEREGSGRRAAGAAGAPGAAGGCGAGGRGGRGRGRARAAALAESADRSHSRPGGLHDCRPRFRCAFSAAPSPAPATKDRSNWASSKRCTPALAASPDAARFRRTLAGRRRHPLRRAPGDRAGARAPHPRAPRIGLNHTQSCSRARFGRRWPNRVRMRRIRGAFSPAGSLGRGQSRTYIGKTVVDHRLYAPPAIRPRLYALGRKTSWDERQSP